MALPQQGASSHEDDTTAVARAGISGIQSDSVLFKKVDENPRRRGSHKHVILEYPEWGDLFGDSK